MILKNGHKIPSSNRQITMLSHPKNPDLLESLELMVYK